MKIAPYSIFRYRQVDGRITFRVAPINGLDILLTNVAQMAVDYPPHMLTIQCNIVLISFDPLALVTFDFSYHLFGEDYVELIHQGTPIVFFIRNHDVFVEALNPDDFFAKY